jgi:nicotinate phosphoribosyltransferase
LQIFPSSGFDEYKIAEVLEAGAPIDALGVGTKMGVSAYLADQLSALTATYKAIQGASTYPVRTTPQPEARQKRAERELPVKR